MGQSMNQDHKRVSAKSKGRQNRTTSLLLGFMALCVIIVLAKHPVVSQGASPEQSLVEIVALQNTDRWVHGILIAIVFVLAYALTRFSDVICERSAFAIAGCMTYQAGCISVIAAMLADGFLVPNIAIKFVNTSQAQLPVAIALMSFCSVAIRLLTKFGFLLMSIAFVAWAVALWELRAERANARWEWVVAALAGVAPAAYLLGSQSPLVPHSLMAIISVQTIWYLTVARLMWTMNDHPSD
jgi:hypothetical protein